MSAAPSARRRLLHALLDAGDVPRVVQLLNDAAAEFLGEGARPDGVRPAPLFSADEEPEGTTVVLPDEVSAEEPALEELRIIGQLAADRLFERRRGEGRAAGMAALHQLMDGVAAASTPRAVAESALAVMSGHLWWEAGLVTCAAGDGDAPDDAEPEVLATITTEDVGVADLLRASSLGDGLHGAAVGTGPHLALPHVLVWPIHGPTRMVMVLAGSAPEGVDEGPGGLLPPVAQLASVLRSGMDRIDHVRAEQQAIEALRANQAKSEFLSRMSHELRTPLNAVLGFAQLLELDELTDEARDSVAHIRGAGDHLLALVDEVLDIAKIEAGRMGLSVESVWIRDVVDEAMAMVAPQAAGRRISMHVSGEGGWAATDRQRALQVVLNLLSNAVKYNRDGGSVEVLLGHDGDEVSVQVADSGPGIPESKIGRLFTPFDRLDAEEGTVRGTGLGLALSKRLAEVMGGTLTATSEVDVGTTFRLAIPIGRPAEEVAREVVIDPVERTDTNGSVLYIEDNTANVVLMRRVLARRPGIHLTHAVDGVQGLSMIAEQRPDLVLLDLDLPGLDGQEVLERLRVDAEAGDLPVVVVSADISSQRRTAVTELGIHEWITKPFTIDDILTIVDRVLGSEDQRGETGAQVVHGAPRAEETPTND